MQFKIEDSYMKLEVVPGAWVEVNTFGQVQYVEWDELDDLQKRSFERMAAVHSDYLTRLNCTAREILDRPARADRCSRIVARS